MTVKNKDSNSVHQELLSAAQDIISLVENAGFEITEEGVLRKSDMPMDMKKDEDEEMPQEEGEEEVDTDEMPDMGDIDSNMEEQEEGEGEEEEMPEELDSDEDGELEADEMSSLLKEMEEEELQELAEMIVSELESRGQSDEGMDMEAEKSMDMEKGYHEMQKSFSAFAEKVTKSLEDLSKKVNTKPAQKPAKAKMAYGKADVDVLEKSDPAPKASQESASFNKQETIDFLMNRQRAKDPLVKSSLVYEASRIQDNDEKSLKDFHRKLAKSGIQIPKF